MRRRHSLRFRVAAAFAGLGALLSLLFAAGIWFAAQGVSQRLMDQTLQAELDDYMARRARNPHSLPPDTAGLRGYVAPVGVVVGGVPAEVAGLPPGQHEVAIAGVPYRVAVVEHNGERYTMLFSEERQRARENRFLAWLAGGALLTTLLASAGGLWLAGRVIAPLTELARAVGQARDENLPRLSGDLNTRDEIGELTRAFDGYVARLAAFIERERAFAADASHELRTPVTVIRGAAEMLADDPGLTPGQARRVARIERAAAEMSALIAALLLLAREEAAPVEEPCDSTRVVRDCLERYRELAAQRRNSLDLETAGTPPRLEVDPAFLAIVVGNLVRNAVAHTEDGMIRVRLLSDRIEVTDTGRGIDSEEMGRVFQRYYRGPESTGSGIGLSLVKRICDRHGWAIELESRVGGGTTAVLRFAA